MEYHFEAGVEEKLLPPPSTHTHTHTHTHNQLENLCIKIYASDVQTQCVFLFPDR